MPLPSARTLRYGDLRWQDTAVKQIPRHRPYRLLGELCGRRCATGASRSRNIAQRQHALSCRQRLSDI